MGIDESGVDEMGVHIGDLMEVVIPYEGSFNIFHMK